MNIIDYKTINVRLQGTICFIQFNRPEANNTINDLLVKECLQVINLYGDSITIIVLEGLPEVFCFGADFQNLQQHHETNQVQNHSPEPLYDLWTKLASGPFITISHVKGRANAGGIGFIAASDVVLADETAQFSLSELLFGLLPACVMPFLIRRIGYQKANYLTLMTQPISAQQALTCGLVDAYESISDLLLKRHLLRLNKLPKKGIIRYKQYMCTLNPHIFEFKKLALDPTFLDPQHYFFQLTHTFGKPFHPINR